jgi:alkane 1-monooxygenase
MRLSDLRFLVAWLLPALSIFGLLTTPHLTALWVVIFWLLVILLDGFVPGGKSSPAALQLTDLSTDSLGYFSWVLRGYVVLQLALIAVGGYVVMQASTSWLTVLGIAFGVGYVTGAQGITFAHELGHSKSKIDRFCGWVLMTTVCYGHFMVEHYRGHHPRAATYEDAASARYGETLYRFLPRTVWGSFISGWRLEAARLKQMKSSWPRSPLAWSAAASLGIILAIAGVFIGFLAINIIAFKLIAYFIVQSIIAFTLLEMVNYIEHYGLQRNKIGNSDSNKREPFSMMHAWNADHVVTNSMLANLQRHSDHHMHATKPYPTLEPLPGPQLPTGYAGCLILAMVPPLWFSLMHKRLELLQTSVVIPA